MTKLIFWLLLGLNPFKQEVGDIERVCMSQGYFIINWASSPRDVCEISGKVTVCYLLNPFQTEIRFGDPYVQILKDNKWLYDLGVCQINSR